MKKTEVEIEQVTSKTVEVERYLRDIAESTEYNTHIRGMASIALTAHQDGISMMERLHEMMDGTPEVDPFTLEVNDALEYWANNFKAGRDEEEAQALMVDYGLWILPTYNQKVEDGLFPLNEAFREALAEVDYADSSEMPEGCVEITVADFKWVVDNGAICIDFTHLMDKYGSSAMDTKKEVLENGAVVALLEEQKFLAKHDKPLTINEEVFLMVKESFDPIFAELIQSGFDKVRD